MGDAYAKATGELTLVSVHSGPGMTNALTGIGEAAKSRTPLVVLAGDVPTGAVKSNYRGCQGRTFAQRETSKIPRLPFTSRGFPLPRLLLNFYALGS
jgi:pyruvate/2-oxoacid:ferredoxin oxidoreductase alpha subunit